MSPQCVVVVVVFPLLDAVVIGPGLQLHGQEVGMIPKQEAVTMFYTICEFIRV